MKQVIRENKHFIILISLTALVTTLTSLIAPILLQIAQKDKTLNGNLLIIIFLAMLSSFIIQMFIMVYKENYAAKFNTDYLFNLLTKMYDLEYDAFLKLESSYLINRIFSAVDALYQFLISSFSTIVRSGFTIILSLTLIHFISLKLSFFMFLLIPINYFGFRYINKQLKQRLNDMQKSAAQTNKNLIATFGNHDAVKIQLNAQILHHLLYENISDMYQTVAKLNKFAQTTSSFLTFLNQTFQTFVLIQTSLLISQNQLPLANLIIVSILLPLFFASLGDLTKMNIDYNTLTSTRDFIETDLDQNLEIKGNQSIEQITTLSLKNPSFHLQEEIFGYTIDIEIEKGDIIYLTGKSGCGKSSLLKLLLQFRHSEGIYINQMPINQISQTSLRPKIGYLSQNPLILTATIEENIGLGTKLTSSQKEYLHNTKILEPIFETKSWETLLTENGSNLSGGEKQRLAIARLLMTDADLYILDECTSNIDEEASLHIFKTLLSHAEGKIVIYTSHDQTNQIHATKTIKL